VRSAPLCLSIQAARWLAHTPNDPNCPHQVTSSLCGIFMRHQNKAFRKSIKRTTTGTLTTLPPRKSFTFRPPCASAARRWRPPGRSWMPHQVISSLPFSCSICMRHQVTSSHVHEAPSIYGVHHQRRRPTHHQKHFHYAPTIRIVHFPPPMRVCSSAMASFWKVLECCTKPLCLSLCFAQHLTACIIGDQRTTRGNLTTSPFCDHSLLPPMRVCSSAMASSWKVLECSTRSLSRFLAFFCAALVCGTAAPGHTHQALNRLQSELSLLFHNANGSLLAPHARLQLSNGVLLEGLGVRVDARAVEVLPCRERLHQQLLHRAPRDDEVQVQVLTG
jgi:hypothetical protein